MTAPEFARPIVLAAGVRVRREDGNVLLVQHHSGPVAGRWSVPFDRVGDAEVAEAAAMRVLRDQLHLSPGSLGFAETLTIPAPDHDFAVNVFDAIGWSGEPRFSARDFDDAGWVDPSNLRGADIVAEVAEWLAGAKPVVDPHEAVERALVDARGDLLAAYDAVPLRARERPLDGEWAAVDVLHHCAAREAYTLDEAVRLADRSGHIWREFNSDQAEADRRLRARPSDAEVQARALRVHDDTLRVVQSLMPEQLLHYGPHPSRGVVQVRDQIEEIARHDREHIEQLRAMQSTALLQARDA